MATGKATTYDLVEGLYLDIEPMIHILTPFETPLLGQYGADGRSVLASKGAIAKKVEWLDETLLTPRTTVAATATTGQTYVVVASGDTLRFGTGDVILIGAEYMRVTGYGNTTDSLVVTRAFSGSAATVATSAAVIGVGTALPEGSDPENARYLDRSNRYNLTQIFGPEAIQVSASEDAVRKYGIEGTTEFEKQLANKLKTMAVALEQAAIYGVRTDDTTNKIRTMGGLWYYIATVVDSTTTQVTEAKILDNLQTTWDNGGHVDRLLVGMTQKRRISALATGLQLQVGRTDNGRGTVVDYLDWDGGRISFLLDRYLRSTDAIGFERDQAEWAVLRPMIFEMLAKTGDSKKGQCVGERSMRVRRQSHAFKMSALT